MNIQEYYLIKYAADKDKKDDKGSSSILNKLLKGNPYDTKVTAFQYDLSKHLKGK